MEISKPVLYGIGGVIVIAAIAGVIYMATRKGSSSGGGVEVSWPRL